MDEELRPLVTAAGIFRCGSPERHLASAGMKLLRKMNKKLGSTLGYEIRRAGTPGPEAPGARAGKGSGKETPGRSRAPQVAFRPPENPETDRLLKRPVFIISPVRSGSTLLRLLLNAHPELHSPHELHVRRLEVRSGTKLAERSMEALGLERGDLEHLLWDRVMHRELVRSGKSFIVEKTPSNAFAYQRIAACWPDARFIFLLRHPASIARSWYEADPDKRNQEEAALDALRYMRAVERARKGVPGHTVCYEDLTEDPETSLKGICAFLGIDWDPGMLDYGSRTDGDLQKGLGDWKEKIKTGSVQPGRALPRPEEIPGPLREISAAWGYTGDQEPGAGRTSASAHAEISEVWPQDGRIRLVGDIHGHPADGAGAPWRLLLVLRGDKKRQRSYASPLEGAHFDVSFPVADLAPAGLAVPARWDIYLATGTGKEEIRLRAGRLLDGVRNKKKIMVFPSQPAASGDDAVLLKPYYTIKDNLSIECLAQHNDRSSEQQGSEVQPAR
jgi:Sulfotransferase family